MDFYQFEGTSYTKFGTTKFGIGGPLADLINFADFLSIGSGVLIL